MKRLVCSICRFFFFTNSTFEHQLFPESLAYNNENLEAATGKIQEMDADLGGTELWEPLRDIYETPVRDGLKRQIFVITDGQVGLSQGS
jgi:hypothetical protein